MDFTIGIDKNGYDFEMKFFFLLWIVTFNFHLTFFGRRQGNLWVSLLRKTFISSPHLKCTTVKTVWFLLAIQETGSPHECISKCSCFDPTSFFFDGARNCVFWWLHRRCWTLWVVRNTTVLFGCRISARWVARTIPTWWLPLFLSFFFADVATLERFMCRTSGLFVPTHRGHSKKKKNGDGTNLHKKHVEWMALKSSHDLVFSLSAQGKSGSSIMSVCVFW